MKDHHIRIKQGKTMIKNSIFLISLLVASRFIGLPGNFTPLLALAVFMPRLTKNKYIQCLFPISIIAFTNLFLEPVSLTIFIAMLIIFAITPLISQLSKSLLPGYLSAILTWHIFVNGAVWLSSGGSLTQTYIAAIPFDFKLALSTGLYIALFHYADRILINLSSKELVNE